MRTTRGIQVGVVVLVLGLLGAVVAAGISSALGIRVESKDVPVEQLQAAAPREPVVPPRITRIDAPRSARMQAALDELDDATARETAGTATLVVRHGEGDRADDSYRLTGSPTRIRVTAASETGAVRGVYDLARAAWAQRPLTESVGQEVTSRLPFRMVDLGAAGVDPDPDHWRDGTDYSHYSRAFEDVLLPDAPYIDEDALVDARRSVLDYAHHVLAQGYNAVTVPGFLDYVTFAEVPEVYADDPAYVARAEAVRDAFGPIWQELDDLGLDVYLRTDMLVLSTPLERHLADRFDLDPTDPGLWDVYEAALDEIYAELPQLSGVVLRIGEGGSIYNTPGLDYYSEISVTTAPAVRAMLDAFTDQAERTDTDVVFRTWSVGVGAVGDMHTNPASYDEVLAGIDSPRLVVSTKYSLGDFYSWLPLNDTLEHGTQRRIVELQSRREFEAFGSVPNDLGVLHQLALQRFVAANPHVEGIWTWTQDGGPWRAGPMSLLLTTGFWQLYDLNNDVAARLARDPDVDPAEVTADWVRRWLSTDPDTVAAITEALALSREAVTHGQYVPQFAEVRAFALGLEPPPQMLLFEWDILTGDSAVLDVIYSIARDSGPDGVTAAIDDGQHVIDVATTMRDLVAGTDAATFHDPALREQLIDSLDYQVDLLGVLGAYREMVLRHATWLDTGEGRHVWSSARERFDAAAAAHEATYGDDLALPAYNLTAARIGEARAVRDEPMAWLARGGLLALLLVLGLTRTGRALVRTAATPWRDPGPGLTLARGRHPGRSAAVEPAGADVVPRAEPPPAGRARLGGAGGGRGRRDAAHPLVARRDRGRRRGGAALAAASRGAGRPGPGWLLVRLLDRARPAVGVRRPRRAAHGLGAGLPGLVAPRARRSAACGGGRRRHVRRRAPGPRRAAGGGRSGGGAHRLERPARAPALGHGADPRHHDLPRHPQRAAAVAHGRGRRHAGDRAGRRRPARRDRGRAASRPALRCSCSSACALTRDRRERPLGLALLDQSTTRVSGLAVDGRGVVGEREHRRRDGVGVDVQRVHVDVPDQLVVLPQLVVERHRPVRHR